MSRRPVVTAAALRVLARDALAGLAFAGFLVAALELAGRVWP